MNWMMYPGFANAVRALKAKGLDNETITGVLSDIHSAVVQAQRNITLHVLQQNPPASFPSWNEVMEEVGRVTPDREA